MGSKRKIVSVFSALIVVAVLVCGCNAPEALDDSETEWGAEDIPCEACDELQRERDKYDDAFDVSFTYVVYESELSTDTYGSDYLSGTKKFSMELFRNTVKAYEGENILISPASVQKTLSILALGAVGDSRTQLCRMLTGDEDNPNILDEEQLFADTKMITRDLNRIAICENSIWLKKNYAEDMDWPYVGMAKSLQTKIFEVRSAQFNQKTMSDIAFWYDEYTKGMFSPPISEVPENTGCCLFNTAALRDGWTDFMKEAEEVPGFEFKNVDGKTQIVSGIRGNFEMFYFDSADGGEDTEGEKGFLCPYAEKNHGRYAFMAILPPEGVAVKDYVSCLTSEHLEAILENMSEQKVELVLPQFSGRCKLPVADLLKDMDVQPSLLEEDIFLMYHEASINMNRPIQMAHVDEFTDSGVENAVYQAAKTSLSFDRPFIYAIVNIDTKVPFMMGVCNSIDE